MDVEARMTLEPRPKRFPPPEFPPRRPAAFARTPPAIFPPILGLLGLAITVRLALLHLGLPFAPGDLLAGVALALWAFAAFAYGAKIVRRPAVVTEDLRVLPGRSGLAATTMGGMAGATLLAAYAPVAAKGLLLAALVGHAWLAVLLVRLLLSLPPEQRKVNPTMHLSFVGFIVGAPAAVALGWDGLAWILLALTLPVALVIWALSAAEFLRQVPPPPLRPLLAIHVAPAALMATVAGLLGLVAISTAFMAVGVLLAAALLLSLGWLTEAGVTPMWGAFTFPLTALAMALILGGDLWLWPGMAALLLSLVVVPAVLWWVLKRWPGGKLAAVTNAAEA
jgi:tellurite resistance protein